MLHSPVNLYASKGLSETPSKFNHDFALTDIQSTVKVSRETYDCSLSCVFVIESIGYNQLKNLATVHTIDVTMVRSTPTSGMYQTREAWLAMD